MSDVIDATNEVAVMSKRAELANIREVRQYGISDIEVREQHDSDTVTFTGYATVFNHDYEVHDAYGSFMERIAPKAFARTLADQPDVVLNLNHGAGGTGLPIARTKSGTLTLVEDSVGLRVSASLDKRDPDVQAILPKMLRGDLDEMSLAFRVAAGEQSQEWNSDYTDRTIRQINLSRGDVSIVTFGANPATVAALRAALADEDVRAQLFAELEGRVLTTTDVVPAEPEAESAVEVGEPAEPETEPETEPVADVEAEVVESADEVVGDDEARQQGSGVPVSYYLSQLVDRRLSA